MPVKTLIVYISYHHGNTEVVARAMGEVLDAELRSPAAVMPGQLADFDLVGFASGNYFGRFDMRLISFIEGLPRYEGKKAFVFSTYGGFGHEVAHNELKKYLMDKGFKVVGEWYCLGFDTYGFYKLLGGIYKGRPNEGDIEEAKEFARGLVKKPKPTQLNHRHVK